MTELKGGGGVSVNVYKYRRYRIKGLKWGDYDPLFEKCWAICADLGVWGRRGTHFKIRGVGVVPGRLWGNQCQYGI